MPIIWDLPEEEARARESGPIFSLLTDGVPTLSVDSSKDLPPSTYSTSEAEQQGPTAAAGLSVLRRS